MKYSMTYIKKYINENKINSKFWNIINIKKISLE